MKKLNIIVSLLVGVLCFTACDADRDDNPVIDLSKTQDPITLNIPTFANGTYDLQNTDTIVIACTAPNYGFPATVTYVIQLSLDEDMSTPTNLTATYINNKMYVPGKEFAIATTKQLMDKKNLKQNDFPQETPVYIRIHAYIDGVKESEANSNIVKLSNVKTKFALPDVEMPEQLYVNGNFTENNWEKAVPSAPVNGAKNVHWRIVWIDSDGILTSPIKGPANYADDYITTTYECKTAGFSVDADGKLTAETAGWYTMIIDGKMDNDKRTMKLSFEFTPTEIWLIGTSIVDEEAGIYGKDDKENGITANCWNETILRTQFTDHVKFTLTSNDMKGEFKSPVLTSAVDGDGGTRAYVKIRNYDWWKSEFFVFNKVIAYRGNGGDQERVNGAKGQRVYFKFSDDTGYLKLD